MNRMVQLFLVLLFAPLIQSERHLFTDTGIASAHWSPAGNHILYTQGHDQRRELFSIDADGGNELQLTEGALNESARWSPDGSQIAYTRIEIEYSGNEPIDNIIYRKILRVMNVDGSQDHAVLERTDDFYPNSEWSPDGSKLLVWSDRELFTIAPDGSNLIPLMSDNAVGFTYVWSPDGQQIAFIGRDGTSIWMMNADGSEARRLISRLNLGGPVWTPDSQSISFAYNDEQPNSARGVTIGIVNASDGSFRDIVFKQTGYNAGFSWSPDGTKLIYSDYEDIYSINADGSGDTNLTNSQLQESLPIFSPDGSKIAYINSSQEGPGIYVMDSSGANSTRVTFSDYDVLNVAWSPTGAHLLFVGNQQPRTSLHVISADGGVPTLLLEEVGSFAIAPDTRKIAYMPSYFEGRDLYTMNLDGSDKTRLTMNEDVTMYAWSPDGKRLAVYLNQKGLYVVAADATTITDLNRITIQEISSPMQWLPDSSQIVFGYNGDIFVADTISVTDTISGSVTQLTNEGTYIYPQSSPTERKLVFFRVNELGVALFVYDVNGAGLVKLRNLWGEMPGLLQWSPDGSKILYSTSSFEPFAATDERTSSNAPLSPPVYSKSYVINADGSDNTFMDGTGNRISWTQDGHWLVIGTTLVSPDGLEKIVLSPGSPVLGQWSPDNKRVLYLISNGPGLYPNTSIYVARLNLPPP